MPSRFTALLLRRLREHIQRFQESSNLQLGFGLSQGLVTVPKQGWLEQPLDPFNASDRRTFLQVRLVETTIHCTIWSVNLLYTLSVSPHPHPPFYLALHSCNPKLER